MRFTGTTLETSQDFFLGYLQASGSQLTYSEEFTDPSGGQTLVSKAVINLGDGDTGNAEQFPGIQLILVLTMKVAQVL